MCGIAGIYAYSGAAAAADRAELLAMRDRMAARGPDGAGAWLADDGRVGLAHRRLSIIDLSDAGAQPMASADGRLIVTFNGEIYNYRALRRELEASGCVFRSQSDTEVLLHLYAERGAAMVHALRGMFAFALWDAGRRKLLLVRDPYGIKPLYYADDGRTLRFASQVKALLAGGRLSREAEPAGSVGFYLFGSVPEPYTAYRAIRAVPAGAVVWIDAAGAAAPHRYATIAGTYVQAEAEAVRCNQADAQRELRAALLDSVRHHLVADVPVGAFLSAGVDSGALVGLMRDAGQDDIQTLTLSFREFRGRADDEAPLAEEVARHYGTRHTTRIVTEQEFRADLPKILDAMDQPSIDGVNTWFVAKATRELGLKVAISGLGGDELFGGYSTFRELPRWVRWLALPSRLPLAGEAFRRAVSALAPALPRLSPKTGGLLKHGGDWAGAYLLRRGLFMPWELDAVLDPAIVREGLERLDPVRYIAEAFAPAPRTAFGKVAALESSLYMRNQLLRDTDWASMAHSLEVRVPLVDVTLLRRIGSLAATGWIENGGKAWLAAGPAKSLPAGVTGRTKTGFSTPLGAWLQRSAAFHSWNSIGALSGRHCPWARRWAYQVASA